MSKTANFLSRRSNPLPPIFSSTGNSPFLRASSALNIPTAASKPFHSWIRASSRRRLILGGFGGASLWMNNNMSGNFGGKSFIASARQTNPSPVEQVSLLSLANCSKFVPLRDSEIEMSFNWSKFVAL